MAPTIDLTAYKRVPFIDEDGATIVFAGENFVGGTYLMHIRANPGDTGTPILSLSGASAGTQGISVTYDAEYLYVDENGAEQTGPASLVLIQINETTLEGLSLGTPTDKPVTLYYDLHITPSGAPKRVASQGKFIIKPGVTI